MDLKLFKYWFLVDLHFLDFSCTLSLISNLTPQTEQEVDLNCPPVMWSPQAGLIEIKCDQLHGAPDSTAQIIWQGDQKKKKGTERLMNVFPHRMLQKSAFANWPSIPLSVKMAHRMACWAQREEESSISVKQLRARRAGLSKKVLTGDDGVDIGWGIMSAYFLGRMKRWTATEEIWSSGFSTPTAQNNHTGSVTPLFPPLWESSWKHLPCNCHVD